MARLIQALALIFLMTPAFGAPRVVTALVHSDQTYILDQSGTSIQEYNVGDTIYLVMDGENTKKGFHRVTFDPTNLQGDGWVADNKVRVLSNYRSADGKLPSEYDQKYVEKERSPSTQSDEDLLSGEATFIDELVSLEQSNLGNEFSEFDDSETASEPIAPEDNPFEEDLEFLFQEDEEFNETFESARNEMIQEQISVVGISNFSQSGDRFAQTTRAAFEEALKKRIDLSTVVSVDHAKSIETVEDVRAVNIPSQTNGVLFGVLSSQIGTSRLLKIKYYDSSLKQFLYEKVVNLPMNTPSDAIINNLAQEVATFLRTQ